MGSDDIFNTLGDGETAWDDGGDTVPPGQGPGGGLNPGEVIAARYEVIEHVGRGGMGDVYKVKDTLSGKVRALKFIRSDRIDSQRAQQRFREEADIVTELSHPNIVKTNDLHQHDDQYFIVMEFVDGHSLAEELKRRNRLPLDKAVAIVRHVLDGLDYAHNLDNPVYHCDLKPQNIMLAPNGTAKIMDFGIARVAGGPVRQTGSSGTPYFEAPELRQPGAHVDARADVYSIGVILYQLVTGDVPRAGAKPPSQRVPGIPEHFDRIVFQCLEDDPNDRPDSAKALAAALDLLHTTGASARTESKEKKGAPLVPILAAASAILVLVFAGAAFFAFRYQRTPGEVVSPQPPPTQPISNGPNNTSPAVIVNVPGDNGSDPAADSEAIELAEAARTAAVEARNDARAAGAHRNLSDEYSRIESAFNRADTLQRQKKYAEAQAAFNSAAGLFNGLVSRAGGVETAKSAADRARDALFAAKTDAESASAEELAQSRWTEAKRAEGQGQSNYDRGRYDEAEAEFIKGAGQYRNAAAEAREVIARFEERTRSDRHAAEQAMLAADTEDVRRYAKAAFDDAKKVFDSAAGFGPDANRANTTYRSAKTKFEELPAVVQKRRQEQEEAAKMAEQAAAQARQEAKQTYDEINKLRATLQKCDFLIRGFFQNDDPLWQKAKEAYQTAKTAEQFNRAAQALEDFRGKYKDQIQEIQKLPARLRNNCLPAS